MKKGPSETGPGCQRACLRAELSARRAHAPPQGPGGRGDGGGGARERCACQK